MDYICRILVRRPSFNTGFVVVFPWPPAANGHSHDCWPKLPESPFIFSGERTCLLNNKAGSSHLYLSVTNHYEDLYMKFLFVMKCLVYIIIWFILNTNPPVCNEHNVQQKNNLTTTIKGNHRKTQPMHARDADKPWLQSGCFPSVISFTLAIDFCWSVHFLLRRNLKS